MRLANRWVTLALSGALLCSPGVSAGQVMVETALSAVAASLPAISGLGNSGLGKAVTPQVVAFNWLANGAANPSAAKAQASLNKYRVINGSGSWICSPAGFGRRSVCYAG